MSNGEAPEADRGLRRALPLLTCRQMPREILVNRCGCLPFPRVCTIG